MLTGSCYFRGNYISVRSLAKLLDAWCQIADFVPDKWNVVEPINIPFNSRENARTAREILDSTLSDTRCLVFFTKRNSTSFELSFNLVLTPFQGHSAHSSILIELNDPLLNCASRLAKQFTSCIPNELDFASIPHWDSDKERYLEFNKPLTAQQFQEFIMKKKPAYSPFGPFGCLGDVYWFNFYGKEYVQTIGKERLVNAGWAYVEEVGSGLACFATENILDPTLRERRDEIARSIEEFVWSPGCKKEDKIAIEFDFSKLRVF